MTLKHMFVGGFTPPTDYVQVHPHPGGTTVETSEKLDAAKAFLGTRYCLHPKYKPRDPRKLFKARRKKTVRKAELKHRKEVKEMK